VVTHNTMGADLNIFSLPQCKYPGDCSDDGLYPTGAKDSKWQWDQLGHMQLCISLQDR